MADAITKEQLEDLEYAKSSDRNEFHELLKEYAGIVAESYVGFSYYDEAGNYLGDSNYCDVRDLLESAYVEVVDNG